MNLLNEISLLLFSIFNFPKHGNNYSCFTCDSPCSESKSCPSDNQAFPKIISEIINLSYTQNNNDGSSYKTMQQKTTKIKKIM